MMSKRWIVLVVLAAAIGAAVAWVWWPRPEAAAPLVSTPAAIDPGEAAESAVSSVHRDPAADSALLAPATRPFKPILPGRWEQARRGDASAQCRIAAEYQRCRQAQDKLAIAELLTRQLETSRAGDSMKVAALVLGKTGREEDMAQCDDLAAIAPAEAVRMWRSAALSGNGEARLRYATGAVFPMGNLVELADELKVYQREALPMAQQTAAAGDGRAVIALALAYSPDSHVGAAPLLAQVTGSDLRRSLALFLYADRTGLRSGMKAGEQGMDAFIRTQIDLLSRAASPAQLLQAEQDADQLARTWRRPRLPETGFALGMPGAHTDAEACAQ